MKKNLMMRLASGLLVAVLLTTCAISGTFAKYVTSDNAGDSARVAKWGVTVVATDDAFFEDYAMDDVNHYFTYSVESSTADNVVAPGTRGVFGGLDIKGTPEVAVNIEKVATLTLNGWMIDSDEDGFDEFYCPIIITVGSVDIFGLDYDNAAAFAASVEAAIEAANGQYAANTDLSAIGNMSGSYSWRWDFVDAGSEKQSDLEDTLLGNSAAAGETNTINLAVSCTVTQID